MEENRQKNVVNNFEAGSNCQVFNGNITGCTFAMPGSSVTQQCPQTVVDHTETSEKAEVLADAVAAVQQYMWGASAYAVLFCEYRDHRNYPNNMAQFERDIDAIARERHLTYRCPAGTLSDAFRHNPYLEKHVDNWPVIGVKTRSQHLLRKFQEALP
jgi:hypothetical protein